MVLITSEDQGAKTVILCLGKPGNKGGNRPKSMYVVLENVCMH